MAVPAISAVIFRRIRSIPNLLDLPPLASDSKSTMTHSALQGANTSHREQTGIRLAGDAARHVAGFADSRGETGRNQKALAFAKIHQRLFAGYSTTSGEVQLRARLENSERWLCRPERPDALGLF
ncbi:hypothetical protein [Allomesorhizobium camelthorni]|uniref:Uncharacterized protein n=1 Tax=Allomesorhizobium camelthorni TaxID=475069 RepID=A0A6G4W9Q0_9HYPH|nr:hypothetical protein [Mesorhizobium camelthorni]NGO51329.1 hypothetical protein [Mesorhizobium camelthorni]